MYDLVSRMQANAKRFRKGIIYKSKMSEIYDDEPSETAEAARKQKPSEYAISPQYFSCLKTNGQNPFSYDDWVSKEEMQEIENETER